LELAVEAAKMAGEVLKERFGSVTYKLKSSHHDLVTEADRLAEERILELIRSTYPDHGLLSEESPPRASNSPYLWVIDPLDGTTNFAHAIPFFAVSIALEEGGRPILGVVYDPMREELFSALSGEGAKLNGQTIRVSRATHLEESLLATGFPYKPELSERNLRYFKAFLPLAQSLRRLGSASLCLAYVAAGRLDGYWDLDLKPWDFAAGAVIVAEAGGGVSDLKGGELTIEATEMIASNGNIHHEMLRIISESG